MKEFWKGWASLLNIFPSNINEKIEIKEQTITSWEQLGDWNDLSYCNPFNEEFYEIKSPDYFINKIYK